MSRRVNRRLAHSIHYTTHQSIYYYPLHLPVIYPLYYRYKNLYQFRYWKFHVFPQKSLTEIIKHSLVYKSIVEKKGRGTWCIVRRCSSCRGSSSRRNVVASFSIRNQSKINQKLSLERQKSFKVRGT